jgi:type I restriction enzyme S subunit
MKGQWKPYKLGEVCTLINGRAYSKPELLPQGKYPVLRVGNFFTNDHWYYSDLELASDKYCDKGDLLYAWSASFGPRIWTGGKVIFHYHIWKVQPNPSLLEKDFLLNWFLWDADQIKKDQGTGTTMIHVAKGSMEERDILVPPRPEQQRIVGILAKTFEGIATTKAKAEKNLQNARALFDSHLESVFTKCGEGWMRKHLKDVCEKITDGTHQTPTYYDVGIPFLSSRNVTSGRINWDDIKYIDTKQHREMHKRVAPRRNDILLAKNGTTGVAAIVDRDITFDIYVSLALLRPRDEILPKLLLHFVNSPVAKRQFNKRLKGIGVPNLHLEEIREVVVSFPKSLQGQEALATELDNLRTETQELASVYQRKLTALEALKKSLLHQAFTGKL